jgi:hypothetical protein
MNERTSTVAPSGRRRRWIWILVALVVAAGVLTLTGVLMVWSHFASLPRFDEWVKSSTGDSTVAAWPSECTVLAKDGAWSFTASGYEASPPPSDADEVEMTFEIQHGADVLLRWTQVVSLVGEASMSDRAAVSTRTKLLETGPNSRALARVYFAHTEQIVGEDSAGKGHVRFDVWLVCGSEPSEVVVLDSETLPNANPGGAPSAKIAALPSVAEFFGLLHPTPTLPAGGPVHHVSHDVRLTAQRRGQGQSAGHTRGFPEHWTNSSEYSYSVTSRFAERFGGADSSSSSSTFAKQVSWNGRTW